LRLEGFLRRNAVPYQKMPLGASDKTTALLEQYGATVTERFGAKTILAPVSAGWPRLPRHAW